MSTATNEEIRQLSEQAPQTYPPRERRLSNFLSLAPSTSDSYPRTQRAQTKPTRAQAEPLTAEALAEVPKQDNDAATDFSKRRTSSLSSDASKSRLRFLKLGPVHWGEHQDDHKADFHEVAVE
jgi:hypothetical protein